MVRVRVRVGLRVREIWNGKLILTAERRSNKRIDQKFIYTLTNCPIFRSENKPSSEARRKMRITLKSKKKNENETKSSLQITIWKCDDKNNGLLLVQKTRWYHISVSFVTSIYSGLGLRLVSSRFNDKNAFSKLKKGPDFSCTYGHMCVYGPTRLLATTLKITILFLTRSAIGYCFHSNRKRPRSVSGKGGVGVVVYLFLKNAVLGLVLGLIEYWCICQSEG